MVRLLARLRMAWMVFWLKPFDGVPVKDWHITNNIPCRLPCEQWKCARFGPQPSELCLSGGEQARHCIEHTTARFTFDDSCFHLCEPCTDRFLMDRKRHGN